MWNVKAGDEVFAVGAPDDFQAGRQRVDFPFDPNTIYAVEKVVRLGGETGLVIAGHHSPHWTGAYHVICFRKADRRDLSAWLKTSIPNTDHLDRPRPAKKRERVE